MAAVASGGQIMLSIAHMTICTTTATSQPETCVAHAGVARVAIQRLGALLFIVLTCARLPLG
eukprot:464653-Pyramimonas_sp.AAC.1